MNFIALVNLENALRQTIEKLEKDRKDGLSKESLDKLPDNSRNHILKTQKETEEAIEQLRQFYAETASLKWNSLIEK